jgi:glycosyltransferase involved in cell wall biosynthesis
MKIVQIVTQMEAGGAQQVALLLTEALRNRGHEVELWFMYVKRPTYMNFPGVRVLVDRKPSGLDYFKIAIELWYLLRSHKPDVLITHTHYANVMGQFVARLCGVSKRVVVQQNPLSTYPKVARWADWLLGTLTFYSINVAVSQAVINSAIKYPSLYREKLTKIYNGSTCPKIEVLPKKVRARWGLPEDTPILVNVGRLAYQKNQGILLEALVHLPNTHLILVGEGELRASLQKRVVELKLEKRVSFLGELRSQDVYALLRASDIFVFPSLFEGTPMALVEAIGSGLPVVASNIPVMQEVLDDAGILVPSDSAEDIARAVRQILDSPELATRMRGRSLERARVFSLQNMVDSYEAILV